MKRFLMDCRHMRDAPGGEARFQGIMEQARPIPMDEFVAETDLSTLLEPGENLEEFIASDPSSGFYRAGFYVFIQTCGFEFFFG